MALSWSNPVNADYVLQDNGNSHGKYWVSKIPVGNKMMWLANAAYHVKWFELSEFDEAKAYVEAMYSVGDSDDGRT